MPSVSIVLPARDEAARIATAIESLLEQTVACWELIVVDDGSTDDTAAVVESFGDSRIRVLRLPRSGIARSLNAGIRVAAAPLIARQDADDRSLSARLERQFKFLRQHPDVAVVGSTWIEVDPRGRRVRPRARVVAGPLNDVLHQFNPLTHTTVMFRKDRVLRAGGYAEDLQFAEDYDLWLRLARAGERLWNLEEPLAIRVMTGTNVAARHERAQVREELVARWRDVVARRRSGQPFAGAGLHLARRVPVYFVPVPIKRATRLMRGKA